MPKIFQKWGRALLILLPLAVVSGGLVYAQIEGGPRGIRPVASTGDFEVTGIEVNVTGKTHEEARLKGWQEAQRLAWKELWKRKRGGTTSGLSDGTLNGIVSAVVVEQEQIGPKRYVARLGVLFDRARAGNLLGVKGVARRSAPVLLLPIYYSAGTPVMFEQRTPWQRAWAKFRTSESKIDYVRPSGAGSESLLLNAGQLDRRNRSWLRVILDEFGAADIIVPIARIERQWPGGPVVGKFSARYNADNKFLGSFTLDTHVDDRLTALPLGIVGISECTDWSFFGRVSGIVFTHHSRIIHVLSDEPSCVFIVSVDDSVELVFFAIFDDSAAEPTI